MPVMEPNLDAATLKTWARVIDGGPFSSLCWGERIAFDNPDCLTLLGALSAWTDRVRLVTTVVVPQLHDPVMLAKTSGGLGVTTLTQEAHPRPARRVNLWHIFPKLDVPQVGRTSGRAPQFARDSTHPRGVHSSDMARA